MGLCGTPNFSTFTFINASDLKFCIHSDGSCVYYMMRFKGLNGKVCKMMISQSCVLYNLGSKLVLYLILLTKQMNPIYSKHAKFISIQPGFRAVRTREIADISKT